LSNCLRCLLAEMAINVHVSLLLGPGLHMCVQGNNFLCVFVFRSVIL